MEGVITLTGSNVFAICADSGMDSRRTFSLKHNSLESPIVSGDVSALLFEADKLFDLLGFPQPTTESRSFTKKTKKTAAKAETTGGKEMSSNQPVAKGTDATFIVRVKYRQNATWQGDVLWADKNVTKQFRSALELLKLVDSALEDSDVPSDEQ